MIGILVSPLRRTVIRNAGHTPAGREWPSGHAVGVARLHRGTGGSLRPLAGAKRSPPAPPREERHKDTQGGELPVRAHRIGQGRGHGAYRAVWRLSSVGARVRSEEGEPCPRMRRRPARRDGSVMAS